MVFDFRHKNVEGKWKTSGHRKIAIATSVAVLVAACSAAPALAGSSGPPKIGTYAGQSSTNVTGNASLAFEMGIAQGKCSAPGGGKRHNAYCVTVSAGSLIQSPCPGQEFVDDEFFPVTEPIALTRKRKISHTYSIYSSEYEESVRHIAGGKKIGTFLFSLQVDTHGNATGSASFDDGSCVSGLVKISAKLKK
jgi:hypothetical protein